ncbi:unnamed protein product, partial [Mesorhabditis belari]|uniref:Uncharacterized protein n=1 Tax=Mesorhabditis belari TaxID=2138241 RepID=A0AAF3FNY1_9BILA
MTRLAFLLLALVGVIAAQASNQTEDPLKTETAEGHRNRHHHDRSHSSEHHRHRHHHEYGYGPGYYQPQIHDPKMLRCFKFEIDPISRLCVCDLDASVLLVLSRSRGGLHKAHRVRCSDVAAADEDSCTVCCQNAARRDTTLKNEDIQGIVTDTDGYEHKHHHEEDKPNGRYKRSGGSGSGEHHHRLRDSFPNGDTFPWKYSAPNAPTQIGNIQIPIPQYSQPQYSQPQYSPPQYSPPQYSPPQYAPPQYQPPAQAPPAPVYQQPTYVQPVAQSPPVYQPQYQQPTYDQSTYNQQAAAPPSPPVVPAAAAPVSSY